MENVLKTIMSERGSYRLSGSEANKLTKECLQKALVYLMKESPFEKISVTELVKKSGVSRQSFYRNYRSKEAILKDMWQNIYCQMAETLKDKKYQKDTYQWYYDMFALIKENGTTIELLVKAKIHIAEGDKMFPLFQNVFSAGDVEEKYAMSAYEGALKEVINEWFQQGMKEEVADMARLCSRLFGDYHSKLIETIPDSREA